MIESGLILDDNINWVSFHAGYDLGFFVSLLLNDDLPVDEPDFYWWCAKYFPNFYDLKYIGNQILNKSTTNGAGGTNSNTLDEKQINLQSNIWQRNYIYCPYHQQFDNILPILLSIHNN